MLEDKTFTEKDIDTAVEFVNFISDKAEFKVNVKECIKFHRQLSWFQQTLLSKMRSNIYEVKKITTMEKEKPKKKKAKKK